MNEPSKDNGTYRMASRDDLVIIDDSSYREYSVTSAI
jgi:hypothetical protein